MATPFRTLWLSSVGARDWDAWDFAAYDWRRPQVYGAMAKILENRGGFEAVVLEDVPLFDDATVDSAVRYGVEGIYHDPTPMLSAMSWYTKHLGLVTTAATATWPPFMLARALGTLDHMTYGRSGWNIDTTFFPALADSYELEGGWTAEERYDRADEFVTVCKMLWDSWEEDAVLLDRTSGRFADGSKVHEGNFDGRYFTVRGPMTLARPPQRHPVLAHTDMSDRGREFAARHADLVVVRGSANTVAGIVGDLRERAIRLGRGAGDMQIFAEVRPFVGDSGADARALRTRLLSTPALLESGIDTVGDTIVVEGAPASVAADLEDLVEETGVDGIAFRGTMAPTIVVPLVDRVIPLLRDRGLVRTGYRHQGFRANLLDADFVGIPNVTVGGVK